MNTLHTGNELGRGCAIALVLCYYFPRLVLVAAIGATLAWAVYLWRFLP